MSETQPSTTATATEPVTTAAQEANTDPIRTNATNDLSPESRPEVAEGASAPAGEAVKSEVADLDAPKGMAVVETQPINEGVLSYKQPGLVKSLIYSKKFFWFDDEPVQHKHLTDYLRTEKASDVARPNAAHATQTGKGLLFFAKRAEDKPQPQGIINLADIKDVAKAGLLEFSFKYHNHKHAFQALNTAERDGWLVALESRHTEAKTDREGVVGSEGYKSSLERFAKPGAVGAAGSTSRSLSRPKKGNDTKATDTKAAETKVTDTTAPVATKVGGGDSASSSDEARVNNTKSRSQSRKRSSMFGALLGKKEQHDEKKELKKEENEEKREEKAEEKAIKADVKKEEKAEKQTEKEERKEEKLIAKEEKKAPKNDGVVDPAPLDAAAIASRVLSNPVIPAEGTSTEEPVTAAETAPATGTSSTPTTTDKPAATTARESTPKPNKRNSIFGSFFNKKEPSASTTPTVNTTTQEPGPAVPSKETELATTSPTVPQTETATKETAPTVDTNAPVTTTETPATTSATTPVSPDTSKANRRSSFFSNLGTKKEKRTGGVSDAEGTDGEGKKSGGFGGLLRKASRAQGHKPTSKPAPATDGVTDKEAPAPINKEPPTTEPTTDNEVVSETTTAPSQTPVQAAA
ncbi:MAG: hypothetical protein L6R41_000569 [Letrouitia leprolyta]|nr:MAG: hypothetical protein L6R41_000569 [Letrouitia leprolyta]